MPVSQMQLQTDMFNDLLWCFDVEREKKFNMILIKCLLNPPYRLKKLHSKIQNQATPLLRKAMQFLVISCMGWQMRCINFTNLCTEVLAHLSTICFEKIQEWPFILLTYLRFPLYSYWWFFCYIFLLIVVCCKRSVVESC